MNSGIQAHGSLELLVRNEAERYGWKARVENINVDPLVEDAFGPRPCPGRGDVLLTPSLGGTVRFEYELPEDVEDIIATVRQLIGADQMERDRLRLSERAPSPIEVG